MSKADRVYYLKNREKQLQKNKEWRNNNPDYNFQRDLRILYGMTVDDYEKKQKEQNYCCAICLKPEAVSTNGKQRRLAVDHDHNSGTVRQLLCFKCNTTIGHLENNPRSIDRIIRYIAIHDLDNCLIDEHY